jgi:cyclopropane-fatty-acyl-phospholipid synthase
MKTVASVPRAWYESPLEQGWLPDALIRYGIRRLCRAKLRELAAGGPAAVQERFHAFWQECRESPLAIETDAANEQHYEVPAEFFALWLGPERKYSCGYWPTASTTLAESEIAMLDLTAARAQLADGQAILDLGCGWGAFTLYAAQRFPRSRILAVSNSPPQRRFIEAELIRRGLTNVEVRTADINHFDPGERFHRIVSVEMLEHVRNHRHLLQRARTWLPDDGLFFIHIFCHRVHAYPYELRDPNDWMTRYFFQGGMMPSFDWLLHEADHFRVQRRWLIEGTHYQRTLEAWLVNLDRQREAALDVLARAEGEHDAQRWFVRWRVFLMACAEFFGLHAGTEWMVGHYLLSPRSSATDVS